MSGLRQQTTRRQRATLTMAFIFMLFVGSNAVNAGILGVEDAAMYLKAVEQLKALQAQYELMQRTLSNSENQLNRLKSLEGMNSGHYGYGVRNNSLGDLRSWQNPASNWQEALEHLAGGNEARYAELVKSYTQTHPWVSDSEFQQSASASRATTYRYSKQVTQAVAIEATKTYNELNQRLQTLHDLTLEIDKTPNTKSATDLNSRLIAELGFISLMNLKLQTLVSQQLSQTSANELAAEGELARFNTPHHEE